MHYAPLGDTRLVSWCVGVSCTTLFFSGRGPPTILLLLLLILSFYLSYYSRVAPRILPTRLLQFVFLDLVNRVDTASAAATGPFSYRSPLCPITPMMLSCVMGQIYISNIRLSQTNRPPCGHQRMLSAQRRFGSCTLPVYNTATQKKFVF